MDSLMEALQSGAAFRDRRKRTPRNDAKDGQTSVYNCCSFPEQPRTMTPISHSFPKVLVHACLRCINPLVSLEILLGCSEIYVVYRLAKKTKQNSASLEKPDKKNMPKDITTLRRTCMRGNFRSPYQMYLISIQYISMLSSTDLSLHYFSGFTLSCLTKKVLPMIPCVSVEV
ncbi:hypothetical protein PO909_006992 [Leuciscus waleckii]